MRSLTARYQEAVAAIDAANAGDPTTVELGDSAVPLAMAHGQLAAAWVLRLVDEPDEALLIAARAHHLRRWELPRERYPAGRAGYLRWRRDQKVRHAADVAEILTRCDYSGEEIERVQRLIRREAVAGSQTVEDAACLVFFETQLASVADKMDRDLLIDVIGKTVRKMSPAGVALIATIPLGAVERQLLAHTLGDVQQP